MSCVPLQLCRFCLVSAAHTSRKQTIQPATQAKQSWIWILDQLYDWLTIAVAITCRLNETQRIWLVKLATSLLWKYFEILWNPRVCKLFKLHRTVLLGITGFPVLHCWNKLLQHKLQTLNEKHTQRHYHFLCPWTIYNSRSTGWVFEGK